MNKFENNKYEKAGLKFDKDRVLTYSHLSCPLECRYCFVDDINFNQKKDVAYLDNEQLELLEKLPEEIKLIMLGCDTEFFQSKKNSLETLEKLVEMGRDISVITKLNLEADFIRKIGEINKKLQETDKSLSFSMSITCMESYTKWEPKTPNPKKRIETLRLAHQEGLKTMVALRPLLPDVSKKELEEIIVLTKEYCNGYYSGPLYLKKLDGGLVDKNDKNLIIEEEIQPHWMPDGNIFYKITKKGQMENLSELLAKYNKPLFEGAAEGIQYLKNI
jgi:DNA repair photolyase